MNDSNHFRRTLFPHWDLSSLCLLRELSVPIVNLVSNMLRELSVLALPRRELSATDRIPSIRVGDLMTNFLGLFNGGFGDLYSSVTSFIAAQVANLQAVANNISQQVSQAFQGLLMQILGQLGALLGG